MKVKVKINGAYFIADNPKDAQALAKRYGGKIVIIPATR